MYTVKIFQSQEDVHFFFGAAFFLGLAFLPFLRPRSAQHCISELALAIHQHKLFNRGRPNTQITASAKPTVAMDLQPRKPNILSKV